MNRIAGILLLLCLSFATFAKDFPAKPNPPRLVNDFVGVLNEQEKAALESKRGRLGIAFVIVGCNILFDYSFS